MQFFLGNILLSNKQLFLKIFCRRLIQKTRLEHDPTEDARATMELIQLKLSKSMNKFCN
jgi:hypothetical protein